MKRKWSNLVFFLVGGAVGGVISAIVTDKMVEKTYRNAADEEIFKADQAANERIKVYKDENKKLKEKISRQKVTINTLAGQLKEATGGQLGDISAEEDDPEADPRLKKAVQGSKKADSRAQHRVKYTHYAAKYSGSNDPDVEFPDYEDRQVDPNDEEEAISRRGPVIISEDTFATTALDYSKEDIAYYLFDGKVISEDGEYLDNYAALMGTEWLNYGESAGDVVYVRNDNLGADYCITWVAGRGEDHISCSDDTWED